MLDENFKPATPTEFMLWRTIRDLQVQLYKATSFSPELPSARVTPDEMECLKFPPNIKLYPSLGLLAGLDERGIYRLTVREIGGENFAVRYYMDQHPPNRHAAMHYMHKILEQHMYQLGKHLLENR